MAVLCHDEDLMFTSGASRLSNGVSRVKREEKRERMRSDGLWGVSELGVWGGPSVKPV